MIEQIIQIRKEFGLNQEEFAKKLGLSRNFINQVENGKKNFSDRTIADICREFKINEDWIRTGEGNPKRETDIEFGQMCADIGINDPRAREAIEKYYELSPEDKELWWKFMERFIKK